jgi:hypothetical protein
VSSKYYYSNVPVLAFWGAKYLGISALFADFLADAAAGTLPSLSFVDPRFTLIEGGLGNDDHPHADLRAGEAFLGQVYRLLVVAIGVVGCNAKLLIRLLQQILGFGCVSVHIKLIGLLGLRNAFKGLRRQPLCGRQIRVPPSGNVIGRELGDGKASSEHGRTERSAEDEIFSGHLHLLRNEYGRLRLKLRLPECRTQDGRLLPKQTVTTRKW